MAYLIGTDEAGYGPNLGPLVISATVWKTPGPLRCDLYELLQCVVRPDQPRSPSQLAIGDSKQLYQARGSLAELERAVWAGLGTLGHQPQSWMELCDQVSADPLGSRHALPWYARPREASATAPEIPVDLPPDELQVATDI